MFDKFFNTWDFFALEDFRYFLLLAKKNFKNLTISTLMVSLLVLFISLNLEEKFRSKATLVISPDESNLVNIDEAYSIENIQNRVNNQIAILKSEEVIEYIIKDNENVLEFEKLYSSIKVNPITRIFKKKKNINNDYIKTVLKNNFTVSNLPRSDVVVLSFVSNNAKSSQLALKNIIDSYQRYEVDTKIQITNYANSKISERLKELALQMQEGEKKLAVYKKENKLVDTGNVKQLKIKEIQSISNNILESKNKKQQQESDLIAIKAADDYVDILLSIKDLNERK